MSTQCTPAQLQFHAFGARQVIGRFDGGRITSDAGGLLLRETDLRLGLLDRLARCFSDYRNPNSVEHTVRSLLGQRVYALALGYEDLNDHEELRRDSLLALLVGKSDLKGGDRVRNRDRGYPLAGASTLNRLELGTAEGASSDRYKRIAADPAAMDRLLVDVFVESHAKPPREIWLDLDATDDPLHGRQEGRFFHGYYRHYCYLPLYIFCGEHLLCARLRPSNIDASAGSVEELERIVGRIRARWPGTRIVVRGDSGFCREPLMRWCEERGIGYVFGLARNARLVRAIGRQMHQARTEYRRTGEPARRYRDFRYRTRKSWSRSRRVVGKAQYLPKGSNPRFVVTDLGADRADAKHLYEALYCARGDMEKSDKRTATGFICRSHQQRHATGQSAAAVLCLLRLRADARAAPVGTGRHRLRQGPVHHDPAEITQDRRTPEDHRAQGLAVVLRGLSLCGGLRTNPRQSAKASAVAGARVASASYLHCIGPARGIAKGDLRLTVGVDPKTASETARFMPSRHHRDTTLGV